MTSNDDTIIDSENIDSDSSINETLADSETDSIKDFRTNNNEDEPVVKHIYKQQEDDDDDDDDDDGPEDIELTKEDVRNRITTEMKKDYAYPDPSDPELQYKIYKKREFYSNKIPPRPNVNDYNDIKEYRDIICTRQSTLYEHQAMLSNFINPDTPYKGLLLFHGLGTGKCIDGSSILKINNNDITIKDLWDSYVANIVEEVDKKTGGTDEWKIVNNVLNIATIGGTGRLDQNGQISKLYRQHIKEFVREITLENGSKITTTMAHMVYKYEKGSYIWSNKVLQNDYIGIASTEANPLGINNDNLEIVSQKVTSILYKFYDGYVYDLEIDKYHNYVANNILCHNTCAAIAIAEKFKTMVQKYNTKIYVLVSGPLIKENWKQHLLICTGETYRKYQDKSVYIDEAEENKLQKNALNQALQYYRFMSYRSFYKRVLGEKIVEKKTVKDTKVKVSYRKTDEGEFERDIAVDRLYNLNNSIIIVDEAHNLTGNAYGEALKHIVKNSINLKLVLLSATPMKNLADDIVELLNLLRPQDAQMERDKIFTTNKIHLMEIKDGGIEYFKNMAKGYVSHVRGADPLTFATRVDKGEQPDGLIFTKVVRCKMLPFQRKIYDEAVIEKDDTLDRRSEAVANFVFPGLSPDRKELVGYY
jgi:hypothetical protein